MSVNAVSWTRRLFGFVRGRMLVMVFVGATLSLVGSAEQDGATSQPRPARVPPEQPAMADQAVSVEPPSKLDAPAPSATQQRGKAVPPSVRERIQLISAARQSAADELIRVVESQVIEGDLTVGRLLGALPPAARSQFRAELAASPQIGGARFPTPGTAEVQLQADGAAMADQLLVLAREGGEGMPVELNRLELRLASWRGRTFTATGGSASSVIGPELRARPENLPPEWAGVSEDARRTAFLQARENAVTTFMEAIGQIEIPDARRRAAGESTETPATAPRQEPDPLTIHKALTQGKIEQDARQWLSDRPVSRMKYTKDRKVEVKLALEPAEWVEQLKVSLSRPDSGFPEITEQDWAELTQKVADKLQSHGGVGSAAAAESERPASLALPSRPPEWTSQTLSVRGSAEPATTRGSAAKRKLATQEAALKAAREELRLRLNGLRVSERESLGDLAAANPGMRDLIDSFVQGARPASTHYHENGSVTVEVVVMPRSLWQALERRLVLPSSIIVHE